MLIRQILSGMRYLTSQERVVHCDLKPRNILFHNGELKISDFGISQTSHDLVSEKRDVWSLGVIYFEMLYGLEVADFVAFALDYGKWIY